MDKRITFKTEYKKTSLYIYRRLGKAVRHLKNCWRKVVQESILYKIYIFIKGRY